MRNPTFVQDGHDEDLPGKEDYPTNSEIEPKISKCRTYSGIFLKALKLVSVEPIIFCHMFSLLFVNLAYSDFILDRICRRDLNFDDETCNALAARQTQNLTVEETSVQRHMAGLTTWRFAIEYSVPTVLVLYLGAWSDIYGRKVILILPMVGTFIKEVGLFLCTYFESWTGTTVALFYTIPSTVTGSFPLFTLAFYSYLTDTTSLEYRTVRFGLAGAFQNTGVAIGSMAGGFFLSKLKFSFRDLFLMAGAIELSIIVSSLIFIKNTIGGGIISGKELSEDVGTTTAREIAKNRKGPITGIFKITRLFEAVKILFKPRESFGRLKLWVLLLVFLCSAAPFYGESSVIYLFLRKQLNWDAGQYGNFAMFQTIAAVIGVLISVGILSYWLKWDDSYIGLFGSVSQISSSIMYAFAKSTFMIYAAPVVDILNGAMILAVRSISTKSVESEEHGKILSIFAGIDAVNPLLANVAYAGIYSATFEYFPGAFFLMSAALALPPFVVYGVLVLNRLKGRQNDLRNI